MSKIKFTLHKPGDVTLAFYTKNGLKIDELTAGYLEEGDHTIFWKPKISVAGSVLNYRLEVNKNFILENMVIIS